MARARPGGRRPRVLVVEDDAFIAIEVEATLDEAGYDVVRASSLADVRLFGEDGRVDCAVLDVRLRDGDTARLAEWLRRRAIPFLVTTGLRPEDIEPPVLRAAPILDKPFCAEDLVAAVGRLIARRPAQVA